MVVFRHNQDQPVRARDGGGKTRVFESLAGIVAGQADFADIDRLGFDFGPPANLVDDISRDLFALTSFPRRSENYRNEERTLQRHRLVGVASAVGLMEAVSRFGPSPRAIKERELIFPVASRF